MTKRKPGHHSRLGMVLHRRRKQRGVSLWTVARETHIRTQILGALERPHYPGLPHNVHSLGFLRRYAKFLGLDASTIARQYLEERGPLPAPRHRLQALRLRSPIIGSRLVLVVGGGLLLVAVLTYLLWQALSLTVAPALELNQPANNQVITSNRVEVSGRVAAGAEVTINGHAVGSDERGAYHTTISLPSGLQTITVTATNRRGKQSRLERSVLIKPQ